MMVILSNIIQSETVRRRRTETNPGFCSDFAKLYQRNGFKSDMLHGAWKRIKHCFSFWRMRGGWWDLCGLLLHCLLCLSLLLTCTNFRGEHPAVCSVLLLLVVSVLRSSSEPGGKICMVSLNILKLLYKSNQLTLRGSDGRHWTTPEPLMQVKDGQKMLALRIAVVYHLKVSPVFSSPRPSLWFQ